MDVNELLENFEFLDDWEDRYSYLIELGDALEPMPEVLKVHDTKVEGCISQVWMVARPDGSRLHFIGDSDARIVRGLVGILMVIYQDKTPAEILAVDIEGIFKTLGLGTHLTANRRNGFVAMVGRIRALASAQAPQ